jgi:peptide deformylase
MIAGATPIFITADYPLPIHLFPDMTLRVPAREVSEKDFEFAVKLGSRMRELVDAANALGLAATQVGCGLAVFSFCQEDGTVVTAINPVIETMGPEIIGNEGCLSLGPLVLPVSRPQAAKMRALGENGEFFEYEAEDLWARVIQHENDHLRGRLIIDITTAPELLRTAVREPEIGGFILPPPPYDPIGEHVRQRLREAKQNLET